jgi:hypothetical protein
MIALNHALKDVLGAFPDLSRNMKKARRITARLYLNHFI